MNRSFNNAAAVCSAIAAVLIAVQQNTHLLPGAAKRYAVERERCYGVVRAGKNDCGSALHACAGRAAQDARRDEWLMLPAGTCERIAGGTLAPPSGEAA
jgi:uncharacterized membrane protein